MSEQKTCTTCEAKRILQDENSTPEQREMAERVLAEAREEIQNTTLDSLYLRAVNAQTDINQHVPKLKELAEQCDHVTDIGMRPDVSSIGLLAGQPREMVHLVQPKHPVRQWAVGKEYEHVRGQTDIKVFSALTPAFDLPSETDLLFLDTKHNANQIYLELTKYAPKVRRYIVRHDTQIYGETGEDGGPGLLVGIRQYLREHPEWSVVYKTDEQYGLMVLSRDDRDKQQLPGVMKQAWNFSRHLLREAINDEGYVPQDVFEARLNICSLCPLRVQNRCGKCGCPLDHNEDLNRPGKAAYAGEECEIGEWGKHEEA